MSVRIGFLPWPQCADWASFLDVARRIDRAGYDSLWTWDHLMAIVGPPDGPIFEGWTALAAWAVATERVELGLMVAANTFRNPGVVAKMAVTVDHISGGRAWLGLGGAWFDEEHDAFGIDFGAGFGERLDRLDEAVGALRAILGGETFTSPEGSYYRFREARLSPPPLRDRLPIMIGGSGERKTLRTVAAYADGWNTGGSVERVARKVAVLEEHCAAVGRDPAEIERTFGPSIVIRDDPEEARRVYAAALAHNGDVFTGEEDAWFGPPEAIAERWRPYLAYGMRHLIADLPAPFDLETVERLIEVQALLANE
ncbi:MAG: hypothetical protein A2X23_09345 [Chloroflexi bacterium GWC2_73_18]|nr:MAG: hypothetical protein A2X23_09345 [Chloroflexi bacterium GWC2_73_18]